MIRAMVGKHRVLLIPARVDFGPYRSLERVEESTRNALLTRFEVLHIDAHPGREPEAFLSAFRAAEPIHAIVDHSDHALHGPITPRTPSLYFALGGMPNGVTMPWLRRNRLKTTDVFLVNCTSDLEIYQRALGGSGPRAELLPFGVDADSFRPRDAAARASIRARLGLAPDAFVILFAGRLNIQKNLHSLALVFRAVASQVPSARLLLAGEFDGIAHTLFGATNEGYEAHLRSLFRQWGLEDRVIFTGKLGDDRLAATYAAADLFATLTLHNNENFGYAAVEAMACGLPVVASHFGGLKDTVVHGETGFHVETVMTDHGLRAAWRQAIEPILRLARDNALRETMGRAARARAATQYSLTAYSDRLTGIVTSAIARARDEKGGSGATFRFAPEAMALHLRNLHRTYARSQGQKRDPSQPRVEYESYRWFQGPYATRDTAAFTLKKTDALALITRCHLDRASSILRSLDPIWPRDYALDAAELDLVAALEPGISWHSLELRGAELGLPRERVGALVERLLHEGVLFPLRPFVAS